jgi:hypothetical protein
MEDERRRAAERTAAEQRSTNPQIVADAERVVAIWNERQSRRMPMLFAPTIGAAIAAGFWFLWVRCPACRTINAIDLRTLDRHHDAAITSLVPVLSCRSCRPNAPFAELVRLSRTSIADGQNVTVPRLSDPCSATPAVARFRPILFDRVVPRAVLGSVPKLTLCQQLRPRTCSSQPVAERGDVSGTCLGRLFDTIWSHAAATL